MNGLYSNLQQKKKYYSSPELYINGFWVSLLGIIGIRIIKPTSTPLKQLLDRNYTTLLYTQDSFVDDTLPDYLISIKVLRELGVINVEQTRRLFTQLDKFRTTGFRNIHQGNLRNALKLLPIYKLRPNSFIADSVYDFLSGKTDLEFVTNRLFIYNEQSAVSGMISHWGNLYRTDIVKYGNE